MQCIALPEHLLFSRPSIIHCYFSVLSPFPVSFCAVPSLLMIGLVDSNPSSHISTTHLPYQTDAAVYVSSSVGDDYDISSPPSSPP